MFSLYEVEQYNQLGQQRHQELINQAAQFHRFKHLAKPLREVRLALVQESRELLLNLRHRLRVAANWR
jgi:hypothetical protein